jgi:uncharacterized protein YcbX
MTTMRVASLHVYPVKSCRGIDLDEGLVERRGFTLDRRFMVVDPAGTFRTQRKDPALARVAVHLDGDVLALEHEQEGELHLELAEAAEGERRQVRVWRSVVEAVDQGEEAAEFLTAALGAPSRLVYMPDDSRRPVNREHAASADDEVGFADGYPFLVTNVASLDALQAQMDEHVPMARFRPNIVIEGAEPWAEDHWPLLRIGELELVHTRDCTRCAITTTDQHTGERFREPLRTLGRLRRTASGVTFGAYYVPRATGSTIRVGAEVAAAAR